MDSHLERAFRGDDLLVFDGAIGTQLQACGFARPGEALDMLSLTHPAAVGALHAAYVRAGAEVATTNTFGANARNLQGRASVAEVYRAAVSCAREAGALYIAGDMGPTGEQSLSKAYDLFAEQVDAACEAGCDLILVETMIDLAEAQAALSAAQKRCNLPVLVTLTFGANGRTPGGTLPEEAAGVLSSMGAQAVGLNCSLGPESALPLVGAMAKHASCPLLVQPNAGLPHVEDDVFVYDMQPEAFAHTMGRMLDAGATMLGGCCGTTPEYIACLRRLADERSA